MAAGHNVIQESQALARTHVWVDRGGRCIWINNAGDAACDSILLPCITLGNMQGGFWVLPVVMVLMVSGAMNSALLVGRDVLELII